MGPFFRESIKTLRKSNKMTLHEVADVVGCTHAYIWVLENKKDHTPSAQIIYNLAKLYRVTVEELMGEKKKGHFGP
jgi:transcriptional regulator with XRE-family HTH domain